MGADEEGEMINYILLGLLTTAGLASWAIGQRDAAEYLFIAGALLLTLRGVAEAREGKLSVDVLMALVGWILIYNNIILEGLVIYGLYSIAEVMESWVSRLAVRRLEEAQKLIPRRARVERSGVIEEVDIDEVRVGDVVIVRRGEVVPANGVLLTHGVFDTRMITGEPGPVELDKGSPVESGYINTGDPVKVRVTRSPRESTLQLIVGRAMELLEYKGRAQRLIERLTPYMILSVIGVFTPVYLAMGPERSIPILLAGCPSAYIITSASTTAYTIAGLARMGVIVRGGRALEALSRCCIAVLDKTGTVTLGRLKPYKVHYPGRVDEAIGLVSSVAATSLHPVSRALASSWSARAVVHSVREIPGLGLEARVNGSQVLLGSPKLLLERGVEPVNGACSPEDLTVHFSIDGVPGVICLKEEVDEDVVEAVRELRRMGIRVVLASGDRGKRVEAVARILGVDEYYHSMKPEDKRRLVERLKGRGCSVAMIGDGVNDLEAMAASDAGVAVGNIDAVNNIADAVLIRGVTQAPRLFKSSRNYMQGLLAGILAATIVKAGVIILGLSGGIPLWAAALLGDDGSTLLGTGIAILRARTS